MYVDMSGPYPNIEEEDSVADQHKTSFSLDQHTVIK